MGEAMFTVHELKAGKKLNFLNFLYNLSKLKFKLGEGLFMFHLLKLTTIIV